MNPRPLPAIRPESSPSYLRRANAPPMPAAPEDESGPDWRRIWSALLRFKWVVLLMVLVGLGGAFAATRVLRPVYRAQANVWVDVPGRRGEGASDTRGPIRQGALLDADDWVELMRSYIVLDQVVRDLRLYVAVKRPGDRPGFTAFSVGDVFRPGDYKLSVSDDGRSYTLASKDGAELERGSVGDSIGRRLGFHWQPAPGTLPSGGTLEFSLMTPRDAALALGEQLDVRMDFNGNFLAVELRGTNPVMISNILNGVTQRYVEVAAQLKREKLTELTKILENQLATAQQNLDQAEGALRGFRTRNITLPSEQPNSEGATGESRDPIRATFFDMQSDRDQLRRDRQSIERFLADSVPTDALSAIASVQHAPLQRLAREVDELQHRTIPSLARELVTQLGAREAELGRQVDVASVDLRGIPGRTIDEVRLRRNAQLKEQTYTALQQRFDQSRLAAEATVPDVRILDPAIVPQRPIKNTTPRLLLMGFVAGLGL